MADPALRDKIRGMQKLLAETQKSEAGWKTSGTGYRSQRGRTQVILDRSDGRIRVRFTTVGHTEWDVVMEQLPVDVAPTEDEVVLDGLLARLWQIVDDETQAQNAMNQYFSPSSTTPNDDAEDV